VAPWITPRRLLPMTLRGLMYRKGFEIRVSYTIVANTAVITSPPRPIEYGTDNFLRGRWVRKLSRRRNDREKLISLIPLARASSDLQRGTGEVDPRSVQPSPGPIV
jgi:hypothetical protein